MERKASRTVERIHGRDGVPPDIFKMRHEERDEEPDESRGRTRRGE